MQTCQIKRCRQPASLIYALDGRGRNIEICQKHWEKHCDETDPFTLKKEGK